MERRDLGRARTSPRWQVAGRLLAGALRAGPRHRGTTARRLCGEMRAPSMRL